MEKIDKHLSKLQGVRVNQHGYNSYCPFPEHNPKNSRSFHINFEKGLVKCFSCGKYMPLFDFLLWYGVPFDLAVDYIFTTKPEKRELVKIDDYELGTKIPKSFIDRGFTVETLRHFEVGYDEYNRRITTPLKQFNTLYGVHYRQYPKKMWYSDNFQKSNFLYNYQPTEERIYVEGFTDTFRVFQNGTKNVSAILGSKADANQIKLMRRHKTINLALDFDIAGIEGMQQIYEELKYDCDVFVVPYKADLISENSKEYKNDAGNCSKVAWQKGLSNKISFLEFQIKLEKLQK